MNPLSMTKTFEVHHYDLAATLTSGQAFRWKLSDSAWIGVIDRRWVRLRANDFGITAETGETVNDWSWLEHYLQINVDIDSVMLTFPDDEPMRAATGACRGLRLLRQDPWECLASFILSSTKQIMQIQQIISLLCERFGDPISAVATSGRAYSFPSAARLARATEAELRDCKMGFRAPYLLKTAGTIAAGTFDLNRLLDVGVESARDELLKLPGVGRKIADCVLLFAYGFQAAFPVDVWVMKALRQLYYPRRHVSMQRLHRFAATHFGPNAGYAQQYLFHYMRTKHPRRRGREVRTPAKQII
jgi:N-glycosylase/DNA lyase